MMQPITQHLEDNPKSRVKGLWLTLSEYLATDIPEPDVSTEQYLDPTIVWDTQCYHLRVTILDNDSIIWDAHDKMTGGRTGDMNGIFSYPAFSIWIGRICGEHAAAKWASKGE